MDIHGSFMFFTMSLVSQHYPKSRGLSCFDSIRSNYCVIRKVLISTYQTPGYTWTIQPDVCMGGSNPVTQFSKFFLSPLKARLPSNIAFCCAHVVGDLPRKPWVRGALRFGCST